MKGVILAEALVQSIKIIKSQLKLENRKTVGCRENVEEICCVGVDFNIFINNSLDF